jgi:hypothetical protein
MKKMIVFLVLLIMIFFSTSIAAENNWELYQKLDHLSVNRETDAELWETVDSARIIETSLIYNKVSLGGTILRSYDRYAKNHEVSEYGKNENYEEKNKRFYPFDRLSKVTYAGYDSNNNIYLRVYKGTSTKETYSYINRISNNFATEKKEKERYEKIMERIKISNMNKMKDVAIKFILLDDEFYLKFGDDYQEYIVSTNKVIIFEDDLIPNFKINTNSDNSTISVQIIE